MRYPSCSPDASRTFGTTSWSAGAPCGAAGCHGVLSWPVATLPDRDSSARREGVLPRLHAGVGDGARPRLLPREMLGFDVVFDVELSGLSLEQVTGEPGAHGRMVGGLLGGTGRAPRDRQPGRAARRRFRCRARLYDHFAVGRRSRGRARVHGKRRCRTRARSEYRWCADVLRARPRRHSIEIIEYRTARRLRPSSGAAPDRSGSTGCDVSTRNPPPPCHAS
jgi:hypothetical protein